MDFTSAPLPECPPLVSLPRSNTTTAHPDIAFSSDHRLVGSIIEITCPQGYFVTGQDVVTCLKSGKWDTEILPHCTDVLYGVPDSVKLYITIFSLCAALVIFVFTVIFTRMICFRDRKGYSDSEQFGRSTESVSSMAFFAEDPKLTEDSSSAIRVAAVPELDVNMDTFINHGYYDEDRERWRQRISSYDSEFETDFDQYHQQPEVVSENSRKWSDNSVWEPYDFERNGRTPITVMEIADDLTQL